MVRTYNGQYLGGRGSDYTYDYYGDLAKKGYGNQSGGEGYVLDSSGTDRTVERFQAMGSTPREAPKIDMTRPDESRRMQAQDIGYLGRVATGQESAARQLVPELQRRQAANARSVAASVSGGAFGRGAAMRAANRGVGATDARIRTAGEAAAAREQAQARGMYVGAVTGQRATDLGLAKSQAQLDMDQRQRDQQRQQYYEGLGHEARMAQLTTDLGYGGAEQIAQDRASAQTRAENEASRERTRTVVSGAAGATTGALQGWARGSEEEKKPPDPWSTSDVKAKKNVSSLDALTERGRKAVADAKVTKDATLEAGGYLGRDHKPFAPAGGAPTMTIAREDPYGAQPPQWLASYMGQGDISRDDPYVLSDDKAKLAKAWDEGRAAGIADVQKVGGYRPEQLKGRDDDAAKAARELKAGAWDEGNTTARMDANRKKIEGQWDPQQSAEMDARIAAAREQTASPPVAPAVAQSGYVSQLLARARAMVPSDERTKESKGYVPGSMASAMRSMRPSVYEYKPEYAGRAGQDVGEKNVGPMANNMEQDPVASVAVERQPDGMLALDKDKSLKLVMGGLSDLQMQVDQLKKPKRGAA